ncbi:MAG: RNA methyltransferase [Leptospirales bacterium]|nr:RNA methyltransferase [Leptospirales bacterium]
MLKKLSNEEIKGKRPPIEDVKESERFPIAVIAENIRSLYNVGSMFRTSDGSLIEKLWLCGYTGFPPRKEIDKTALGSVDTVPWEYTEDTISVIKRLKSCGYLIAALEHTDRSKSYLEAEYNFPLCIMLGNEVDGLSEEAVNLADMAIEIPMYGIKQSLNVSVAYGIIVYHLVEEFRKKRGLK